MRLVAAGVAGLGHGSAVVAQTVRFHDEAKLRPEEVDADAVDGGLSLGSREAGGARNAEEATLELRLGQAVCVLVEQST